MCGFVGIVHLDGRPASEDGDGAFLRAACGRLAHRGPDDEQFFFGDNVGFGFRRLSIVDLAEGGQPLFNEDRSVVLMTNGEIYNHRTVRQDLRQPHQFRTSSDCEVLVHAYEESGEAFLDGTVGMFATALWDRRQKKLVLARDRLGIKPLYLFRNQDVLLFASEIKALLAHPAVPRQIEWQDAVTALASMMQPRRAAPLTSFFQGIEHLPAAHILTVDLRTGETRRRRYWDPERPARVPEIRTTDQAIEAYRETFRDAVNLRLMADVEYGMFLSGGIDSVSIARMASAVKPFHTFTVLSQSTLGNGDAENAFAAAQAFDLPNHQVVYPWRDIRFAPADWKRVLWLTETPMANAEFLYKHYLHAFAKHCRPDLKVILLGQGSDEFNGGYTRQFVPDGQEENWDNFVMAMDDRVMDCQRSWARSPVPGLRLGDPARLVIKRDALATMAGTTAFAHPWHAYRDLHLHTLQMYNLWHEDRTAAAHGIENRVPFLDHRLVELCFALPERLWPALFWDKAILRQAMEGLVPENLRQRKKVPFFYGEDVRYTRKMMYALLRAEGDALIDEAVAALLDVLDGDAIRMVLDELPQDPEMQAVDALIQVINTGLLQAMANAQPPLVDHANPLPVREITAGNWTDLQAQVGATFIARTPALSSASIVHFAPGVLLVRCEGGDTDASDPGAHYLLVDNALTYVIEPQYDIWVRFLRQVDGQRTVAEILSSTQTNPEAIWKHLEEAIEHGVLRIGGAV